MDAVRRWTQNSKIYDITSLIQSVLFCSEAVLFPALSSVRISRTSSVIESVISQSHHHGCTRSWQLCYE